MIKNKQDLKRYLESDRMALSRAGKRPKFTDVIWKFQIALRMCEYDHNKKHNPFDKIASIIWRYKKHNLSLKCGFSIPINVCDEGLSLAHIGTVIISEYAKIGKNCKIHACVNIGADARNSGKAPKIGSNVYIGPGAKLFGDIEIADNIAIGANAVVNKIFTDAGVSIAGIPAKIINRKGVSGILHTVE